MEIKDIIAFLVLLELALDKPYTKEQVNANYRKLSQIYHPDVSNSRYSDGKKFQELTMARSYLLNEIDYVNRLIINGFNNESSTNSNGNNKQTYEYHFYYHQPERQESLYEKRQQKIQKLDQLLNEAKNINIVNEQTRAEAMNILSEAQKLKTIDNYGVPHIKQIISKKLLKYEGRDLTGYDSDGYDEDGYNREGYNKSGYNSFGRSKKQNDRAILIVVLIIVSFYIVGMLIGIIFSITHK